MALRIGGVVVVTPTANALNPTQIFKELADKFEIDDKVVLHLVDVCKLKDLEDFYYMFAQDALGNPVDVEGKLTSKIRDIPEVQTSRIRRAWASVRLAMRMSEDLAKADTGAEDIDKLLSATDLEKCHAAFWKRHKITYPPALDANDILVSRLFREFTRRQLSVHDALKVRTVAHFLSSDRRRRDLAPGLALVQDQQEDVHLEPTVYNYGNGLLTICIGMGRAGCLPIPGAPADETRGSKTTSFVECPLDVVLRYHFRAMINVAKVPAQHQLEWLRSRDIAERTEWVEAHRHSTDTVGAVVDRIYKQREGIWIVEEPHQRDSPRMARPVDEEEADDDQTRPLRVKKETKKPAPKRKPGTKHTIDKTKDGKDICRAYNQGGCKSPCPNGRLHVCNAKLKNSRACGLRGHTSKDCRNRRRM